MRSSMEDLRFPTPLRILQMDLRVCCRKRLRYVHLPTLIDAFQVGYASLTDAGTAGSSERNLVAPSQVELFPSVFAAIVPVYNLPLVNDTGLVLDLPTLANIYMGLFICF